MIEHVVGFLKSAVSTMRLDKIQFLMDQAFVYVLIPVKD